MSFDENTETVSSKPRRIRFRFSLLALFLFVTLVCIFLTWLIQPRRVVATALFRVNRQEPTILADDAMRRDVTDFDTLRKTQLAMLKSDFVLTAAMRKPGIATLPVFAGGLEPIEWVKDHLVIDFPEDGEVLSISLEGKEAHSSDLARIVDAVAKAYSDEVLFREKQLRLGKRDLLASILEKRKAEIADKWHVYSEIKQESGNAEAQEEFVSSDLLVQQIGRIESEIIRLEDERLRLQTSGEPDNKEFYEQRIPELERRRTELRNALRSRITGPPTLAMRKREIEGLQRVADELAETLERMEIEANAPSRIEQIQQAVVSPIR